MNVSLDSFFKLAPYCNEYQTHKNFFESENKESEEKFKTSNNAVPSKVIDVGKKNFIFVSSFKSKVVVSTALLV